jgi:hypothetical protein
MMRVCSMDCRRVLFERGEVEIIECPFGVILLDSSFGFSFAARMMRRG